MKSILFSAFMLCSSVLTVLAQVNDSAIDSLVARRSINEKVTIKLSTHNSSEWFEVAGMGSNPGTEIRPNSAISNALSLNYRFASFSYKFLVRSLPANSDDEEKGETRSNGLHFSFNPGQWTTDLSWNKTQGYYLHNTEDFNPVWTKGDPYIQFPDLHSRIYRLKLGRVLNPEFSINSVSLQTEKQLASQGSFIPGIRLTYYTVDDRTPLTGSVSSSQKSDQFEAIFNLGYIYTIVFGSGFYSSLDVRPGLGFLNTRLLTRFARANDWETHSNRLVYGFDTYLQLGYDSPAFFAGVRTAYDHYEHGQGLGESARITNERLTWEFFLGIRIKAPNRLKQKMDALESLMIKKTVRKK